jgi:Asp-tRNA(Asn)/Glu-tRNA(Gln) amidotransferase A subunit family amidase
MSAEARVRACLDRIAEREETIGAWTHVDADAALAAARTLDRGPERGPLHGVPIGVKDIIDTADMPTEHGSPIWRGNRPKADAGVVALARAAGMIVLGKTVTTEFATFTPGKTRNPHDTSRTPGGSSSGSAAAVADGMVPLAFGTQTAGSVIRPAAFCGVVGYKPSFGLLPRAGVKPTSDSLDTVGAFARSVAEVARFVGVLARRPDLIDLPALDKPTLGFCRTHEWPQAAPETVSLLEGLKLPEITTPAEHDGLATAQHTIQERELYENLGWEYATHVDLLSARLRSNIENGRGIPASAYREAKQRAEGARRALPAFFSDCDAIAVPSARGEAPEGIAATGDPIFNRVWTLLGVPCVTIPVGKGPNDMPLGVQLVGRIGEDARLLAAAAALEARLSRPRSAS